MREDDAKAILGGSMEAGGVYTARDGTAQRNVTVQDGTVRAIAYMPAE